MQVTREDLNPCTIQLTVVCDAAEVKEGFERAFKQLTKKIKLPGFRPGHAPRAMLANLVSPEEHADAASELIVNMTYQKAIDAEGIKPDTTTSANIGVEKVDQAAGELVYIAKVPLPPSVEIGEYRGLPVERPSAEVTDEEVEFEIERFRKGKSSREAVLDRGVQTGDVAVLSIRPEDSEESKSFMFIAGQMFAALDQEVLGMNVEDMKNLELTFPDNFQETTWAGQTKRVTVSLASLSSIKAPEVDDDFARSLKAENVDDLRKRLRELLGASKAKMSYELATSSLLDTLLEKSKVFVSDNMWLSLADRRIRETAEEMHKNGKDFAEFITEQGMTPETYVKAWQDRAKLEVQRALLIQQIFTLEAMTLNNEDLTRELYEMANEFNVDPQEMFDTLQKNNAMDELQFRSISRKVGSFLLDHAAVTIPTLL
jgi:trigger factor